MTAHMIVTFPWTRPPLSMNDRFHKMQEAKIIADIRTQAKLRFATFPPVARVEVTMRWIVKDRRRRDSENPVATLKPLCDGLVDAGIVPDDTPAFMVKNMPVIDYQKGAQPCVVLDVREIP